MAQKSAFGPGAYLLNNDPGKVNHEMERREAEVWGFAAAMAVNSPEEEQTNLVGALRETVSTTLCHLVSSSGEYGADLTRSYTLSNRRDIHRHL